MTVPPWATLATSALFVIVRVPGVWVMSTETWLELSGVTASSSRSSPLTEAVLRIGSSSLAEWLAGTEKVQL